MSILAGIKGLLQSRKGTFCLLLTAISSVALFLGRLDPTAFAAILSTIAVIYNAAHSYQQSNSPTLPERGSP